VTAAEKLYIKSSWSRIILRAPNAAIIFGSEAKSIFEILLDHGTFKETEKRMRSLDPLKFVDTKPYAKRIDESIKKTGCMTLFEREREK